MRADTLTNLVTHLRAETGQSTMPALGVQMHDPLVRILQRCQEELYLSHDWPFLLHSAIATLPAGEYKIDPPDGLNVDRIERVHARASDDTQGAWTDLHFYNNPAVLDPGEGDDATASLPSIWWRKLDFESNIVQMTFLPRCVASVDLKVTGQRGLRRFVDSGDLSTLDGTLLVMAASVEILTRAKAPDAQQRQARMSAYLRSLKAEGQPHHETLIVGGGGTPYGGGVNRRQRFRVRGVW